MGRKYLPSGNKVMGRPTVLWPPAREDVQKVREQGAHVCLPTLRSRWLGNWEKIEPSGRVMCFMCEGNTGKEE